MDHGNSGFIVAFILLMWILFTIIFMAGRYLSEDIGIIVLVGTSTFGCILLLTLIDWWIFKELKHSYQKKEFIDE